MATKFVLRPAQPGALVGVGGCKGEHDSFANSKITLQESVVGGAASIVGDRVHTFRKLVHVVIEVLRELNCCSRDRETAAPTLNPKFGGTGKLKLGASSPFSETSKDRLTATS